MGTQRNKLFVLVAAPVLALAACSSGPEQPRTVAEQFADALNADDVAAAAALTDNPDQATATLNQLYAGLGKEVTYEVRGTEGDTFTLAATWKLGSTGQEWTYTTTGTAAENGDWAIRWNPATLAPGLDKGPLSYGPAYARPAPRVGPPGGELKEHQIVNRVNLPAQTHTPTQAAQD
ncbi:NTF2-like N-terminal transpeptidase domain-containing protein, partial [Nocardia farcinica]|uniref:NTF2-like N-terminal transpeptidase domain-containing protein n=1 Tax=Nocardia farcinica TaxID=37329 RepID=UPI002457EEA4